MSGLSFGMVDSQEINETTETESQPERQTQTQAQTDDMMRGTIRRASSKSPTRLLQQANLTGKAKSLEGNAALTWDGPAVPSKFPVLKRAFKNNASWAQAISSSDPTFFDNIARSQSPKILWIGCSDSRVNAEGLLGCQPGEVFVHRNIANRFQANDGSAMAVLAYAVGVLKVEHIVVCGHYNCGGISAALCEGGGGLDESRRGNDEVVDPIGSWLRPLRELQIEVLDRNASEQDRKDKDSSALKLLPSDARPNPHSTVFTQLVHANVKQSIDQVASTAILENAWKEREVFIHGWVYSLVTGRVRDLGMSLGRYGKPLPQTES